MLDKRRQLKNKSIPGGKDVRQKERQTAVVVQPVNVDVALFGVLVSELSLNHWTCSDGDLFNKKKKPEWKKSADLGGPARQIDKYEILKNGS